MTATQTNGNGKWHQMEQGTQKTRKERKKSK